MLLAYLWATYGKATSEQRLLIDLNQRIRELVIVQSNLFIALPTTEASIAFSLTRPYGENKL